MTTQTTGAAELPEALRLADALRKMDEAKKYHPSGPGGQMLGCEQYRLVASGFTFEDLQSAAAELRRLHAQVEALSAAQAGVPDFNRLRKALADRRFRGETDLQDLVNMAANVIAEDGQILVARQVIIEQLKAATPQPIPCASPAGAGGGVH